MRRSLVLDHVERVNTFSEALCYILSILYLYLLYSFSLFLHWKMASGLCPYFFWSCAVNPQFALVTTILVSWAIYIF